MSMCVRNTRFEADWMQAGLCQRHPPTSPLRILGMMVSDTGRSADSEVAGLIARCARRDQAAFQRLYESTSPHVLACLLRILRQRALAEDALQEVYVQVWNRAGQYQPERGSAWAWLVSIARYRAIDLRRSEARRPAETGVDLDQLTAPFTATEPELGFGEQAARALERCIGALQPRQRECIVLAYQGGLSHAEVAAEVAEPLGSVKSWIRRGLAALKRCLES